MPKGKKAAPVEPVGPKRPPRTFLPLKKVFGPLLDLPSCSISSLFADYATSNVTLSKLLCVAVQGFNDRRVTGFAFRMPLPVCNKNPPAKLSENSPAEDLRTLFDTKNVNNKTLHAAIKAFGFSAPSTLTKAQLVEYLTKCRDGEDPSLEEWRAMWKLEEVKARDHQDFTHNLDSQTPGGVRPEVKQQLAHMSDEEKAAFLFFSVLTPKVVELVRVACDTKSLRVGENLAEEEPPPLGQVELPDINEQPNATADDHHDGEFHMNYDDRPEGRGQKRISAWLRGVLNSPALFAETFKNHVIIHLSDCLQPTTRFRDQWSETEDLHGLRPRSPIVRFIMGRDHCLEFMSMLTIGDAGAPQERLIQKINKSLFRTYVAYRICTLDEQPIPHFGSGPVVYMPMKPDKYVIKVHGVADAKHAVCVIRPCFNRGEGYTVDQLFEMVYDYTIRAEIPNAVIIADSWNSTPSIADYLHKNGRRFCLSVKNTGKVKLIDAIARDLPPGKVRFIERIPEPNWPNRRAAPTSINPILWTAFKQGDTKKERKPVMILSNFTNITFKHSGMGEKPAPVDFYTQGLGYIDRVNQTMASVRSERAKRSWKDKCLNWFIDLAAYNSWIYFKDCTGSKITYVAYLHLLVWGLIGPRHQEIIEKRIKSTEVVKPACYLVPTADRHHCEVCKGRSSTKFRCTCSAIYLHQGCQHLWHAEIAQIASRFRPATAWDQAAEAVRAFGVAAVRLFVIFMNIFLLPMRYLGHI